MFFRGPTVVANPDRCPSCDARFPVVLPVGCLRSSRNNPMITCSCGLEVELFLYPLRATDIPRFTIFLSRRDLRPVPYWPLVYDLDVYRQIPGIYVGGTDYVQLPLFGGAL